MTGAIGRSVALALVLCAAAQAQPPRPLEAREIRAGVDRAISYMLRSQAPSGQLRAQHSEGATCLAALACMASGRQWSSDRALSRMIDWLSRMQTDNTYVRGLRANVWEYALRQRPGDQRLRALLRADLEWLLKALGDRPGWRYGSTSRDWDNSCTQYGVLGVWAAVRADLDPPQGFWAKLSGHFRSCQGEDGGWSYTRGASSPNMVTAGLASLYLVFDNHYTREPFRREGPRRFTTGEAAEVLRAIERAQGWLSRNQQPWGDGYYLYGIERCGVASGERLMGGADWFTQGARTILASQRPDGSIPLGHYGGPAVNTAFCALFLLHGGAPLALYKLDHREDRDDDLNPRDLANLTRNLWVAYERPVNWQRVSLSADLERMLEAPVVFLSGTKPIQIDAEGVAKLRDYVEAGGTLLAEASDHSPEFTASAHDLVRRMFPPEEYPGYDLVTLGPEHGIYAGERWTRRPRLRGASDGSRTFFFLSDEYMSAEWQAGRRDGDALRFARSLLYYVRDEQGLRERLSTIVGPGPPAQPTGEVLRVARVAHGAEGSHPRDWDAARMCWRLYAPYVNHASGLGLHERTVRLGRDDLTDVDLVHLTGRRALELTDAERQALERYAEGGGLVLVDAFSGAAAFADSARRELEAVFGELVGLPASSELSLGPFPGGSNLCRGVELKGAAFARLLAAGGTPGEQQLLVARVDGRPAVVFSELDLSAAMAGIESHRAMGYTPESARRIVANVIGYALARRRDER